ncbi:MAG TPA: Hsp20/alpha crystallin family protein [Pseudonocardiaceae bacterium]|nr:Hsp20/alpha crystallin family protein [Pseudonocardiaceae bacterium]
MPLMRWDPFTALARIDQEFDDVVRRTFGTSSYQFVPPVEMATDGGDVVITLEVPGVDIDDIDIEVAEGRLTVSGERRDTWENTRGKVLVREMRYGAFRRTFQLPDGIGGDQVEADADRGLLRIRIKNVTKPVEQPRKITVRTGKDEPQRRTIEAQAGELKQG